MQLVVVTEQFKQFELHLTQVVPLMSWPAAVHGSQRVPAGSEYEFRKNCARQLVQLATEPAQVLQLLEQAVQLVRLATRYPELQGPQVAFWVER